MSVVRTLAGAFLSGAIVLLAAGPALAVPAVVQHEGLVLDEDGLPMDGSLSVRFTIYDAAEEGEALWSEQLDVELLGGYYHVVLGEEQELGDVFAGGARYLGLSLDGAPELSPRHAMGTVPYAFVADNVTGDITPRSIAVAGRTLVDADGNVSGLMTGLKDVDGTGSGLDADRLDGLDSSQLLNLADPDAPALLLALLAEADGDGSGLDADTLDGIESSRFMRVDQDTGTAGSFAVAGELQVQGVASLAGGLHTGDVRVGAGATVGVGVDDPEAALHVAGGLRADSLVLTGLAAAPEEPVAGTVYWDTEQSQFLGFDGEDWVALTGGQAGGGPQGPARSCRHLFDSGVRESGPYWIDPDGDGGESAFEVYCDLETAGGGWTLAAKFTNQDSKHWVSSAARWSNSTPYGAVTDLSAGADARSGAWGTLAAEDMMLTDDRHPGDFIVTTGACLDGLTLSEFFSLALASFPWPGDRFYKRCNIERSFFPSWAAEPDWGGHSVGHNDLSLTHDYLVFARTDNGGDTSGVISFYRTDYGEADVGLGALEDGQRFHDGGTSQDVGGPTSCGYNDGQCRSEYPETVYLWVRDAAGIADGGLGSGQDDPGLSCRHILAEGASVGSRAYWIDPDGDGGAAPFRVYCEMEVNGGGWTLAAKLTNQDGKHWVESASRWTGTAPYGHTADVSVGADARSRAWGSLPAEEMMLTDDRNPGDYVATIDECFEGQTASAFFTAALAHFPWGGDNFYKRCDVERTYFPTWAAEPDWGGHNPGHNDLSLTHDYLVIARTDGGGDTSGVVSFYRIEKGEADVGLGALEDGQSFHNGGTSQDIGGPTSCGYNDNQCRSEYPETVFFWVRDPVEIDAQGLGSTADNPGRSCKQILAAGQTASRAYWIDPDGDGGGGAFNVYCEMEVNGGGWTLAAKFTNADTKNWVSSAARWTSTASYGRFNDLSSGSDAKSPAWGSLAAREMMLTDHRNGDNYVATISNCLGERTPSDFFTTALDGFPWGRDHHYKRCDVRRTFFPTWAAEPDWGGHGVGHNDLSLTHDYLVIARTDPGGDTSGVVSFYRSNYGEADVGLGALEDGGRFHNGGTSQDVGGPTSCGYDDNQCRSEYPETVNFWIRE